jgi:hypothetical protein
MPAELRQAPINGVFELLGQSFNDHRGAFLNAFRAHETAFMSSWGDRSIDQVNFSRTEMVGTIRGLHLQAEPVVRSRPERGAEATSDLQRHGPPFPEDIPEHARRDAEVRRHFRRG